MKYSFIGLGKPMGAVNNLFKSHIKKYRLSHVGEEMPLEPGGVFSSNLSAAASFAGENDMCVYLTLEELLINSDIIFIFLPDKAIDLIDEASSRARVSGTIQPKQLQDMQDKIKEIHYMNIHRDSLFKISLCEGSMMRWMTKNGSLIVKGKFVEPAAINLSLVDIGDDISVKECLNTLNFFGFL